MDRISVARRSANMRAIRSANTSPELVVRRIVHRLGYRYRLHEKKLPGKPDLVFSSRRKAIFVHGCFWHQHPMGCSDARRPKSNTGYWTLKLDRNSARDIEHLAKLKAGGWSVLVVWDCETAEPKKLEVRLRRFLGKPGVRRS
jgi:DNA mismatch endonuclease (patch repair protein)